ncbi:hypothetical protein DIE28_13240 [Paracoccus thiocyanatus]|uniref:Uncharacterized protein n=1 Tax=Paracoccus thiocyanatus TaxID=34006 RepID=A0A3D8PBC3_9RHOB|nr:hypothetical protein DIE28_13240 [Paracoccus thiocyanatus]
MVATARHTRATAASARLSGLRDAGYHVAAVASGGRISTEQSGPERPALQEQDVMSKKLALALVLVGLAAACAPKEPEVAPVPVQPEPVFQGKYGAN